MGAQLSTMKTNGGPPYKIAFLGPGPKDKEIPLVSARKGRPSDETVFKIPSLPSKCYSGTFSRKGCEEPQDHQPKFQSPTINISSPSSPRVSPPLSNRGSPPATKTSKHTLLTLPREVRAAILSLAALPSNRSVTPYYNECSVQVPFDVFDDATLPNISTSLLLVNRQISAEALTILYGSNTFTFCDARLATWFCQRIGSVNLQRINTMQFLLTTGYTADVGGSVKYLSLNTFDVPAEMNWAGFVQWLGGRHKLLRLLVSFEEWVGWDPSVFNWGTGRREGGVNVDSAGRRFCQYEEEEFAPLAKWRRSVVEELKQCHVGKVRIERGIFFANHEAKCLRYLMEGRYDELEEEQGEGGGVVEEVESVVTGEGAGAESDTMGDDTVVKIGDETLVETEDVPGSEEVDMEDPEPESAEMEEDPLPELIEMKEDPAPELMEMVGDLVAKIGEDLVPELLEMGD